ncbi:MAG: hypothetical protein KJO85_05960, partial [Gammaproteobacteria bacterium]|nr:hypothetical protein [Gammaproteobacteria bacterium]
EAQGVAPEGTVKVAFLLLNIDFAGGVNDMWFDDAVATSSGANACAPIGDELANNGDFELGTFDCWDLFPGNGTIEADNTENNTIGGTWSAHLVAGPGNNPVIKQSFLAAGVVQPGDTVNISFDMKGAALAGGVIFPELISEGAGGQSSGQLLDTIVAPTADWTTYFYTPMAGADVSGGITFQIAVVCGGDNSCSNDVFIDNVSIIISPGGG